MSLRLVINLVVRNGFLLNLSHSLSVGLVACGLGVALNNALTLNSKIRDTGDLRKRCKQ